MANQVVILDPEENTICWLNPEFVTIEETIEKGKVRNIKLTHPINDDYREYPENWYKIGNKIWIVENEDFESVLYIIDSSYTVKYGSDDLVEVNAEEVLVELNYVPGWFYATLEQKNITKDWLNNVFGTYFDIGTFETPNTTTVYPLGSMNLMSLLRQIESESGNVFTTEYYKEEETNTIRRVLNFMHPSSLGVEHDGLNEIIEVGHNTSGVNYTVDESDSYTAIQPVLTANSTSSTTSTSTSTSLSSSSSESSEVDESNVATLRQAMIDWKNLAVEEGENIPMIVQKNSSSSDSSEDSSTSDVIYTSYWNAPFTKIAGEWFLRDNQETNQDYTEVHAKKGSNVIPVPKIGTVSTSDTDKYAIYNDCANKIMDKRYPNIKIEANVTDLRILTGEKETYRIYDIVYLRIPNYNQLIRARVTKTVKDSRQPGNNKITITSNPSEAYKDMFVSTKNLTMQVGTNKKFTCKVLDGKTKQPLENANVMFYVSKLVTVTETTAEAVNTNNVSEQVKSFANSATRSTDATQIVIDCALYVKKKINWDSAYSGFKYSPDEVISRGKADCCDGARLLATMCYYFGITLKYVHCHTGNKGHVFNQYPNTYVDWTVMRSESNYGKYNTNYGPIVKTTTYPTLPFGE